MILHRFNSLLFAILTNGSFARDVIKPQGTPTSHQDGIVHKQGELDVSSLKLSELENQKSIDIRLFVDEVSMDFSRKYTTGSSWYGEEEETGNVMNLLSTDGMSLTGSVNTGDTVFHIRTSAQGRVIVEEMSTDDFPLEADPLRTEELERHHIDDATRSNPRSSYVRGPVRSQEADKVQVTDDGSTIDIMCVYTKNSMCAEAGLQINNGCESNTINRKPIEDRCALAVEETNTAYEFSGVDTRLRMVYTGLVDPTHEDLLPGGFKRLLKELTSTYDGVMDIVHDWRIEHGADLVVLITENAEYCGKAWLYYATPMAGFSVVMRSCMTGYYSFAHEFGHNQGCYHDRKTYANGGDINAYNYGWQDPEKRFRSIMAYDCAGKSCNRIQRMSNDEFSVNFQGQQLPVGDASNDCARTINDNRVFISQYTESVDSSGGPTLSPVKKSSSPSVLTKSPSPIPVSKPSSTNCFVNQIGNRIEAEDYCAMEGVLTETCSDLGGGLNVGYLSEGDWMSYSLNVPAAGEYTVEYRVASSSGGGVISLEQNGSVLGKISVPKTGAWQKWITISHKVQFSNTGEQSFTLTVPEDGHNINWMEFSKVVASPPTLSPVKKSSSPSAVTEPGTKSYNCRKWCNGHLDLWSKKCNWDKTCGGCASCFWTPTASPTKRLIAPHCREFCTTNSKEWWKKCTWNKCAGCEECEDLDKVE